MLLIYDSNYHIANKNSNSAKYETFDKLSKKEMLSSFLIKYDIKKKRRGFH